MLIPGIPDEEWERVYWNYGSGRGVAGYRHIPSGITVVRECLPDVPTRRVYEAALAELQRQLRQQGLLPNDEGPRADPRQGASPNSGSGI